MVKSKILFVCFVVFTIFCGCCVVYIVYLGQSMQNDWKTHTITGYVVDMKLYNQFPTVELYVVFDTGNFTRITVNPFWTHAQLINFNLSNPVVFTYKENSAGEQKTINIRTGE